jgi:hypothetical protein
MENKEFLKFINEHGGARNIAQAFEEFPPEEEWHKGKIESILTVREEKEEYNLYSIGDIVFVDEYNYKNGNVGNNHLFVIISQNNLAVPVENFGMLISSRTEKLKYNTNKLLKKDENNGLIKDSIVKLDVIYRIYNEDILFKIGCVDIDKVDEYINCYIKTKESL